MEPRQGLASQYTPLPFRFFGRAAELAQLDDALAGTATGVLALVGPGGQGKTAIARQWLDRLGGRAAGVYLWSFYRAQDADLCLRQLRAVTSRLPGASDVSASYCVDQLLTLLRREQWAIVLDGLEVVQYDAGPWAGRVIHPELGRLLQDLASEPAAGLVVLTTRFPLPELEHRHHARIVSLDSLDSVSARDLLTSLGVRGSTWELDEAAAAAGRHAKAVELLGTYLVCFHAGEARRHRQLPGLPADADLSDEERQVARVLAAFQQALPAESQDVLALATAFREPPTETLLHEYLVSDPVRMLLHQTWGRGYRPFQERPAGWLADVVQGLVGLRLLERVRPALSAADAASAAVLEAHPLVRRGFEHVLGSGGRREGAHARAGFLRGRPDRKRALTLDEARGDVELFHAYCDAGLWDEADRTLAALENPRYRFLAPALERDLLLRFFPGGDWRRAPLWPGFRRWRALAVCFELLGRFDEALEAYRGDDAPLRGDALLASGRLAPLLEETRPPHPWQTLWRAYRAHALCLAGRTEEAVALATAVVPVDAYEWTHVFECLLRANRLDALDMHSFLHRPAQAAGHRWADLARQRMRVDYLRRTVHNPSNLGDAYDELLDAYDRAGMPFERCLARHGYARWLLARGQSERAAQVTALVLDVARRQGMHVLEADALHVSAELGRLRGDRQAAERATAEAARLRAACGYQGPERP